jgi:hypothetical protein
VWVVASDDRVPPQGRRDAAKAFGVEKQTRAAALTTALVGVVDDVELRARDHGRARELDEVALQLNRLALPGRSSDQHAFFEFGVDPRSRPRAVRTKAQQHAALLKRDLLLVRKARTRVPDRLPDGLRSHAGVDLGPARQTLPLVSRGR